MSDPVNTNNFGQNPRQVNDLSSTSPRGMNHDGVGGRAVTQLTSEEAADLSHYLLESNELLSIKEQIRQEGVQVLERASNDIRNNVLFISDIMTIPGIDIEEVIPYVGQQLRAKIFMTRRRTAVLKRDLFLVGIAIEKWKEEGKLIDQANRDPSQAMYNLRQQLKYEIGRDTGGIFLSLRNLPPQDEAYIDSLFKALQHIESLCCLNLANNMLESIPASIGNLRNLHTLNLSFNRLTSIPASIGNLTNLHYLNLSYNLLDSLPASIGNLRDLHTLLLGFNRLVSISEFIGNLTNLHYLNLCSNQLTSIPASIGNLTHLHTLNLSYNRLTSIPNTLRNLTNLCELDLSNSAQPRTRLSYRDLINYLDSIYLDSIYPRFGANLISDWSTDHFQQRFQNLDLNIFSEKLEVPIDASYLHERQDVCSFIINQLTISEQVTLAQFLEKLQESRDFEDVNTRNYVILSIDRILQTAIDNPSFKNRAWRLFEDGSVSCGDRAAYTLSELEILWLLHHRELTDLEYAKLAIRAQRYFFIVNYVKQESHSLPELYLDREEVECLLYYCIELKKEYRLPISVNAMLYRELGENPNGLAALKDQLTKVTPKQLLQGSQYWQERYPVPQVEKDRIMDKYVTLLDEAAEYCNNRVLDTYPDLKNLITSNKVPNNILYEDLCGLITQLMEQELQEAVPIPEDVKKYLNSLYPGTRFGANRTWHDDADLLYCHLR